MPRMEILEKHWAIVWSRVSSAHPFIISLTHEKAKPTHRPNSKRLHPQALAHMWARIRIHRAWTPSGSTAVERWVGVGELERGKETGERREAPGLASACSAPSHPPERAAQNRAPGSKRDTRQRPGRWAGLERGARARSQPRPKLDEGPQLGARGQRGLATPAPPCAAGKAVGLSRQK